VLVYFALANSTKTEVCFGHGHGSSPDTGREDACREPFKKFKRTLPAARQDAGCRISSTAFQWSSKVVPHPAGGWVSCFVSVRAGQGLPTRVWFFMSAEECASAGLWETAFCTAFSVQLCKCSFSWARCLSALCERSQGLMFASNSAMALTHVAQTARIGFWTTSCDCGPARWYYSRERGCRIRKTAAPN